ncbi:MAG: peptidoglycan/xylan/chitin deacetylase (PgdA/CDA1 family) [Verrucomicrobiales bacterium]|jgi:peptidoglycan/xylan/chitin deacetylase (PgdA/CDA1 family)
MHSATQIVFAAILGALVLLTNGCKPAAEPHENPPAPVVEAPSEKPSETETAVPETPPPAPPEPDSPEKSVDTTCKVAILGYHKFSESPKISKRNLPTTIHIGKFREQMQALLDNEIPVISMSDFLAWRRGEKNIPPFSVMITIDDGYVSTYDLAFPVLKEFQLPFTVYIYTNFLGGAGKTLTPDEVKEMLASGGEIGSHAVSHHDLRKQGRRSDEIQAAYLKAEAEESRRILREKLGVDPITFSYPYGAYNDDVIQACVNAGYQAMVTIRGQKVGWDTDLKEVGRYIIHGEDDRAFGWAVSSKITGGIAGANNILKDTVKDEATGEEKPAVQVIPQDGSTIKNRRPIITVDLSLLKDVDPDSLAMIISGIGEVKGSYNAESKNFSYQPTQRLRLPDYSVQVKFKRKGQKKLDIMRWKFGIDAISNYLKLATEPVVNEDVTPNPQTTGTTTIN